MIENIGVFDGVEKMVENIAVNSVAPVFVAMFLVCFVECGFVGTGDDGVRWSGESKRGEEFGDTFGGVSIVVVAKKNPLGEVLELCELLEMTHLRCFCRANEEVEMGSVWLDVRMRGVERSEIFLEIGGFEREGEVDVGENGLLGERDDTFDEEGNTPRGGNMGSDEDGDRRHDWMIRYWRKIGEMALYCWNVT